MSKNKFCGKIRTRTHYGKRSAWGVHTNGGRWSYDVFDGTLHLGRFSCGLTIYGLGKLDKIFRYIPQIRMVSGGKDVGV